MTSSDNNNNNINVPENEAPQTPTSSPPVEFMVQLSPARIAEFQRLSEDMTSLRPELADRSALDLNRLSNMNVEWTDANFRQQLTSLIYTNICASITEDGLLPCVSIPNPLRNLKLKLPRDTALMKQCRDE
ncbi:hypothetical protein PRIPAC_97892 [Pristionchus pacificus]|uniref:Uncharacterized protein n=1 Tax=Pristionchus pacificus TaxID=54126 RepID=A0A2A6CUH8_PRIPA|nr:hypothetical protein PRIPAC_97892 [Pristionchus pacificus]|eukprot:PDM81809.1 hypothetical protein PRIPAC_33963 [Pristionchus pacificus]